MTAPQLTRLTSLHRTILKYKKAKEASDSLWAQLTAVLPDIDPAEVDSYGKKHPKKAGVSKKKIAPRSVNGKQISEARRAVAQGTMKPLRDRVKIVLGKDVKAVKEIVAGLAERNWLPHSRDISTYICYTLTFYKNDFERVSRGHYRVKLPVAKSKPSGSPLKASRQALYEWVRAQGKDLSQGDVKKLREKLPSNLKAGWISFFKLNQADRLREWKASSN